MMLILIFYFFFFKLAYLSEAMKLTQSEQVRHTHSICRSVLGGWSDGSAVEGTQVLVPVCVPGSLPAPSVQGIGCRLCHLSSDFIGATLTPHPPSAIYKNNRGLTI